MARGTQTWSLPAIGALIFAGSLVGACAAVAAAQEPPGAIEGTVSLTGEARPAPRLVANTTDPDICGVTKSLEDLVVSTSGGIAHVIVALIDVAATAVPAPTNNTVVLDNRDCRFAPHSLVLRVGDVLRVVNSDATLHTVHWYGPTSGNLALPGRGSRLERLLERPGLYQVKCDVHGWMQAFLRVDPHPYHAVSDERGAFLIGGVPPGSYTLEAWHERLGFERQVVEVHSNATARVRITYDSEVRR